MTKKAASRAIEAVAALMDQVILILVPILLILYYVYDKSIISFETFIILLIFILSLSSAIVFAIVRTQVRPPKVGIEALIGKKGRVIEDLNPEGKILVEGEIWNAVSETGEPIERDTIVIVVGYEDMTLRVRRA